MRILFILVSAALLCGCTLPRIIVLNDPLNAREHNDLGVSYQQRSEFDLAIREYERAAELDADWARPVLNRGNVHAARGEWLLAGKYYWQALRREPENAEAMNNLAWALLQAGEVADALDWARKAVAADSREPAYLDTLAEIQIARRDLAAARLTLEQALTLSPDEGLRSSLEKKLAHLASSD
ncbi:MAG: tetratricopeptide repeat protein [Geobacteraceae bacterium]|nr:tetratricopeptide repeat protein [Geobacteraceae bacterium]